MVSSTLFRASKSSGKYNFVRMRSLKHFNKDDFILKLSNMSWEGVLVCIDIEMARDSFKTIFHSVLDSVQRSGIDTIKYHT